MHSNKYFLLLILLGGIFSGAMTSCKKNSSTPDYNADKTRLKSVIDSLTAVAEASVEGNKPGQYIPGAKEALDSVLNLGQEVYTATNYTQEQVNNALNNLMRAGSTFSSQQLQEVSVENLMGYWKFNGNANDSSGHGNDGVLKTNWTGASATTAVDGGTLPQLVADRFGQANAAYYFDKGATIEVPYNNDLNPKSLTISLWLKTDVPSTGGDYMFAMDRWYGYKLNLQGSNFLYLTVYKGDNNWVTDDDGGSGSAVPLNTWVHAAASYDNANSTVKFYLNGTLVRTITNKTGPPITLTTPYNITIGNELPKSKYDLGDSNNADYYWGPDYFTGSLDDVRFYNTALTDKEVLSIYTAEKTP
ncbi:MAG: LamG domain-containing protein [Bacteroidota bacterium]|nr:LamG domain-containing protein [Bacteroidota bacterium]MDP4211077.1 LamG domain-containing protein [Bacteroidota bacterium]MDP4249188.1 LamG domain-containing protein [Bacteroidota bacterium]